MNSVVFIQSILRFDDYLARIIVSEVILTMLASILNLPQRNYLVNRFVNFSMNLIDEAIHHYSSIKTQLMLSLSET